MTLKINVIVEEREAITYSQGCRKQEAFHPLHLY